jgi:MFS family permease
MLSSVSISYLLANASFQLSFGRLYTIFSIKWVFLTAISLFEVGSLVCAVASNSVILIVGRAIAGLGCAGCFSGALIIGAHSIPLRYRPIYTGILGAISGLAAICGPILGGFLTDKLSWRWCFYVNLPMGAVTIAVIVLLTNPAGPKSSAKNFKEHLAKFDVYGTLVFVPCMVCLLLALQWGGIKYPWKSIKIIALFMISFILFIIFIGIQAWEKENATLPPRIIKQRSVAASAWYACFVGAAFFIVVYYVSLRKS